MKTLVVIPAFNESKNIVSLIEEIKKYGYDYIVINDASNDKTYEIIRENNINALNLSINMGIARVTQIGIKYACEKGYDSVVCVDGDGQHQPKYIKKLIDSLESGSDYAVGSRFINKEKPNNMRGLGSRILSFLIKIKTGKRVTDPTSGMRAIGKKIIIDFSESMNFYAEPDTICYLIKKGYNIEEIDVDMLERQNGYSYFRNPLKSIIYMFSEIVLLIFVQ